MRSHELPWKSPRVSSRTPVFHPRVSPPSSPASYTLRARCAGSGCTTHSSVRRPPSHFLPSSISTRSSLRSPSCVPAQDASPSRSGNARDGGASGARHDEHAALQAAPHDGDPTTHIRARAHRPRRPMAQSISRITPRAAASRSGNTHDGAGEGQGHLTSKMRSQGALHLIQPLRSLWQRTRRTAQ
jgi:hypothetical protein